MHLYFCHQTEKITIYVERPNIIYSNNTAMKKVLIIDDDEGIRLSLRFALEPSGYSVEEAENGSLGIDQFTTFLPDLILLDLMMPVMDGYETCSRIRNSSQGAFTPIIMLTGLDDIESIRKAFDVGATDFVTKPINYALLKYRIEYVLRSSNDSNELRISQSRLIKAQQIAKMGYVEWDEEGKTRSCSSGLLEILGIDDVADWRSVNEFLCLVVPEERGSLLSRMKSSWEMNKGYRVESRMRRSDGEVIYLKQESEIVESTEPAGRSMIVTLQDITEQKIYERRIHHLAYYDDLTGLPNRSLFQKYLDRIGSLSNRGGHNVSILVIGLDKFRKVKETYGNDVADEFLKKAAERLRGICRVSDCVAHDNLSDLREDQDDESEGTTAHLGGDEFVIMLPGLQNAEDTIAVVRRITSSFDHPFSIGNEILHTSLSIGVSIYPLDGTSTREVLKNAEIMMSHAKGRGGSCYQFFDKRLNIELKRRIKLESDLYEAIEDDSLGLLYQPKFDVKSGRMFGAEALIRWKHREYGNVSPLEFVRIAEESDLITLLGEWVVKRVLTDLEGVLLRGVTDVGIAINISPPQMATSDPVSRMIELISMSGIDPRLIELEITENILIEEPEEIRNVLLRFRELGCTIAIDDFGTGFSSLSYLKALPIDVLKIDRSFITGIPGNQEDIAIVKGIIQLGHSLGLKIVAEGVESIDQLDYLSCISCNSYQGFYRSPPVTIESLWNKFIKPKGQSWDSFSNNESQTCFGNAAIQTHV